MNIENIKADTYTNSSLEGIHIVVKPIGPVCRIVCECCLYQELK